MVKFRAGSGRGHPGDSVTPAPLARRGFVKAIAAGGAAIVGGGALERASSAAAAAPSAAQDRAIFKFALLLERLKAAFYAEALAHGALTGELKHFAQVAGAHEREHVRFLAAALGSAAGRSPAFHFGAATRDRQHFQTTAVLLEELAVAAYNGQAANLTTKALASAVRIVSVEGRHAAWIRALAGDAPAPRAADPGEAAAAVTAALKKAHIQ